MNNQQTIGEAGGMERRGGNEKNLAIFLLYKAYFFYICNIRYGRNVSSRIASRSPNHSTKLSELGGDER